MSARAARMMRLALATMTLAPAACIRFRHADLNDVPRIDAVRPDSVLLPRGGFVDVAIVGRGFAPGSAGGNTIEFAGMTITQVAANGDGTTIRFAVPDMITLRGESPPAQLEAGAYPIRVRTAAGASNIATLRVFR